MIEMFNVKTLNPKHSLTPRLDPSYNDEISLRLDRLSVFFLMESEKYTPHSPWSSQGLLSLAVFVQMCRVLLVDVKNSAILNWREM